MDDSCFKSHFLNCSKLRINTEKKYQKIIGFGGAFTEAAAYVFSMLKEDLQKEALHAYFSNEGIQYNLGRVHINSCDFSLGNYTYVAENDQTLKTFSIEHEKKYVIPLLHKANHVRGDRIHLLASPWSPPAYMKDNHDMNHGGKLLQQYADIWAKYYVLYIQEMAKNGIVIDAISVQNEPAATQIWDSCTYTAEEERDFVKNHLGPTLRENGLQDIHLYVWDHNRGDILINRAKEIFADEIASSYIYGLAFHWYCSEDFESLQKFHSLYPDKSILFTEGCVEYGIYGDESKSRWENGEHYAHHMIQDFNHFSQGFIDWNLYLDMQGGPNHVKNFCEAPIMFDLEKQKILYNTSYYYIGHFSKFIHPNAMRIDCAFENVPMNIEATSFLNENQEIVLVILNKGNEETICVNIDEQNCFVHLPCHSITTLQITKD